MTELTLIVHVYAKPDQVDRVKSALFQLIEPTRQEEGCIAYTLHQDNEDPAHFVFHECWASRACWQAHLDTPHLAAYRTVAEEAVESFTLSEMRVINRL